MMCDIKTKGVNRTLKREERDREGHQPSGEFRENPGAGKALRVQRIHAFAGR